ncbi:hypothetical protein HZU38_05555 [Mycolicibacterium vanbaalenii]|uniref:hypothetical protein n=1 Tax=Mycolicibacterium vanbaalenii TaxID=110539 RepID=UPI001F3CDF75|nr:hypothetical protein [Mycolicibacterium vanbaalenii]UJL29966.1 hypothetical protein HZU38_05555 [Mycolicibacterium vanbaalenii]WND56971.1 hypothetical protein QQA43_00715 [Mycolicibacterium vanbaalenii]
MTRALLIVAVLAILATSFISLTLCGILAAIAALAVVGVGLYRYVHTDDDCGYATTPYGQHVNVVNVAPPIVVSRIVHTPAVAFAVIEGGKRPVWDTEIWGAPE